MSSGSRKLLTPTPTRRNLCCGPRATCSLSESAIAVNSSHDEGGEEGVWLRVRILNYAGFNFSTTVRATRGAKIKASVIQDPHSQPHTFFSSFVVRRVDGDCALAEGACCPRPATEISPRRCRR